jgi:predicted Zn-dependent protease
MSSTNQKQSDAELIQRRTNAWNKRPIISFEMFAKTSKEKKELAKAKKENKRVLSTYGGKYELRGIQRKLMNSNLNCKVSFTRVEL